MENIKNKADLQTNKIDEYDGHKKVCQMCIKNRRSLKCAGPYVIGPLLDMQNPKCIKNCLGRKMGTSEFYILKLLSLLNNNHKEDINQGKIYILTEFTILTKLQQETGIPRVHNFFEELVNDDANCNIKSENTSHLHSVRRVCLVLNCFVSHIYSERNEYINLQNYVIKCNRLSEKEALLIFLDIAQTVQSFHSKNVIHRDLKLSNIVLNRSTRRVTIINFGSGKILGNDGELIKDKSGSPAFVSPEILKGRPYSGKAADIWALGVIFFTMLYGRFPFFDADPKLLFRKIKIGEYAIPDDDRVADETVLIIHSIFVLDPVKRVKISQLIQQIRSTYNNWYCFQITNDDLQVVPEVNEQEENNDSFTYRKKGFSNLREGRQLPVKIGPKKAVRWRSGAPISDGASLSDLSMERSRNV
ncbi:serine/threonine-protein kinase 40 isoform X3 [Hydra vulgaris]|uniref:Serine/threonine-protein kinase 40 n=1 Tax=Hydra vulgaris TaxID=6087 RepID=A0ABM4BGL1_HYDVU